MHTKNHPNTFLSLLMISLASISVQVSLCDDDYRYTNCSQPIECGTIGDISYPFWGVNRADYCGIPGYEVDCQDDVPVITVLSNKLRILDIMYENQTLKVARDDLWTNTCPLGLYNTTLNFTLFNYTPGLTNVTLLFGCTSTQIPGIISLTDCIINGVTTNAFFVPWDVPFSLCTYSIKIPILEAIARALSNNITTITKALDEGFGLQWQVSNDQCDVCTESGGSCGFNLTTTQFTCFCHDQPYATACPSRPAAKARFPTAITIAASVIGSVMLFCIVYCLIRRGAIMKHGKTMLRSKKNQKRVKFRGRRYQIEALEPRTEPDGSEMITVECLQFDLGAIESATKKFSAGNKLGRGGFGEVYKGTLPNGQEIAVKRLLRSSAQGAEEFKNEVLLVAKLQHRNLTRLLGFCLEGEETILIYEYVPNRSLDYFLFNPKMQGHLDWSTRQKIIGGIARGILYLHEDSLLKIIHRDLKAGNILLDKNMNPKISDFGLARLFGVDQIEASTNRIVGTYGYMSPEYAMHGQFSVKSDVYSFGVLLLEIVSGKNNSSFYKTEGAEHLVSYIWKVWRDGRPLEAFDPNLRVMHSTNEVVRFIQIGLLCVQEDPTERPTMATVVLMLNSYHMDLPLPKHPAFFIHGRIEQSRSVNGLEMDQYKGKLAHNSVDEAQITIVSPR